MILPYDANPGRMEFSERTTINGNRERGTGILNNELYIGNLVWNRLRYMKDPATGKRRSRLNPESDWITREVPALRIIPQELWDAVKARQREMARETRPGAEPLLHPALSTVYRNAVEKLETLLRHPDTREEAFGLIRSLIDAVILTPVDGKLEIELHGDLAGILALSEAGKQSAFSAKEKALQIKMVAGARSHLYRTRFNYPGKARK